MEREFPDQLLIIISLVKQILRGIGRIQKARHRTLSYCRQFLQKSVFIQPIQQDERRRHEARKVSASLLDRSFHAVGFGIPIMNVISHRVIQPTVHRRGDVEFVAQFEQMQLGPKRLARLCCCCLEVDGIGLVHVQTMDVFDIT